MTERTRPTLTHTTYKVNITLMGSQWNRLEREAERRHITGRELIQAALSQYVHQLALHDDIPLPDPDPEEE